MLRLTPTQRRHGSIGVSLKPGVATTRQGNWIAERFSTLDETCFSFLAAVIRPGEGEEKRKGAGLVAVHHTAQRAEATRLKVWIAAHSVITLSMVDLNLLPEPPLDSFPRGLKTTPACPSAKQISPRAEQALALPGPSLITKAAVCPAPQDIIVMAG